MKLTKNNFYKLVFLMPEILIFFIIFSKFIQGYALFFLCFTAIYGYLFVGYLKTRLVKNKYLYILLTIPIIMSFFIKFQLIDKKTFIFLTITTIIISSVRIFYVLRKEYILVEYERIHLIVEMFLMCLINIIFNNSILVFYYLLLRVLFMAELHKADNLNRPVDTTDIMLFIINAAFILIYPIIKINELIIHTIGYYVIWAFFPMYYFFHYMFILLHIISDFLGKYYIVKYKYTTLNIGDIKPPPFPKYNVISMFVYFVCGLFILLFIIAFFIRRFYNKGEKHIEKDDYIYIEKVRTVTNKKPSDNKNLGYVRRLFIELILLSKSKGLKIYNGLSSNDLKKFLQQKGCNTETVNNICLLYNENRYGEKNINLSKYKVFFQNVIKYLKQL